MTKGIPWTSEEEIQLKKFIQAKTPTDVIAQTLGRTRTAIQMKCERLGLVPSDCITKSALPLPDELPTVEETLRDLAGALKAAKEPGLNRVDVQRLQAIATVAKTYKEILADYINYREIELKLNDMEAKYAALLESKNNASKPDSAQVANSPAQ